MTRRTDVNDLDDRLDDHLAGLVRAAFGELLDDLPDAPRRPQVTRRRPGRPRRPAAALVLAAAAAVVLVGGLVLLTRRADGPPPPLAAPPGTAVSEVAPSPFVGGVRMVLYVMPGTEDDLIRHLDGVLRSMSELVEPDGVTYLDPEASLAEAARILADDPVTLDLLNAENVPTEFRIVPRAGVTDDDLAAAADELETLPGVQLVVLASAWPIEPPGNPSTPTAPAGTGPSVTPVVVPTTAVAPVTVDVAVDASAPVAIGDSVMLGAASELAARGYRVDAVANRRMGDVVGLLDQLRTNDLLGEIVVLHLGNDGPFTAEMLDAVLAPLVDVPNVLLLTVAADRPWAEANNAVLVSRDRPGDHLIVVDWADRIGECVGECLASDDLHLAPGGVRFYVDVIGEWTGS